MDWPSQRRRPAKTKASLHRMLRHAGPVRLLLPARQCRALTFRDLQNDHHRDLGDRLCTVDAGPLLNGMASAQHSRRVAQLRLLAVQEDLEILRLLQQHRGLGVQSEPTAVALRCALAIRPHATSATAQCPARCVFDNRRLAGSAQQPCRFRRALRSDRNPYRNVRLRSGRRCRATNPPKPLPRACRELEDVSACAASASSPRIKAAARRPCKSA